ncbi:MAG TPA: hypothetical protein VF320_05895, partial [Acidimicrobiales bacterium]
MSTPRRAGTQPRRSDPTRTARLQREAGFERGRSITKGIAFGSVAAVAVAGAYLSQSIPGHAASPGTSTSGTTSGVGGTVAPAPDSGTSGGVSGGVSSGTTSGTSGGSATASQGSGISAPASAP